MADQMKLGRATPWLKPQEAADYVGVSMGTLRNWTSAGICRLRNVVGLCGITSRKSINGWPGTLARAARRSRTGMSSARYEAIEPEPVRLRQRRN